MSAGDIPKAGTLVPSDASFGIIYATDQVGGSAAVANEAAIGAIASGRLIVNGTWRYSISSGTNYLYTSTTPSGGFANGTWTPVTTSSSSGTFSPGVDTVATANVTLSGEQTINGVTTSASRVLVTAQTTTSQNGLYTTAAGAWSRTSDANTAGAFIIGKQVSIVGGTQSGAIYMVTQAPTTLGTDPINFTVNSQGAVVNWSAPGAIGSSTPNTGTFTTLSADKLQFNANHVPFMGASGVLMSDADSTLSGTAYNRYVLVLTSLGSLTATRNVNLPATLGEVHVFQNGTTGGQSLFFRSTGSSVGVIVPNGASAAVWADGTDIYPLNASVYGRGTTNSIGGTGATTSIFSTQTVFADGTNGPVPSFQRVVDTTNATPTTVTYTPPTNSTGRWTVTVVARDKANSGDNNYSAEYSFDHSRQSGNVTINPSSPAAVNARASGTIASATTSISVSTTTLVITLTGIAATNVRWVVVAQSVQDLT